MIAGIGTDLIEISRIRRIFDRFGQRFLKKVFTATEVDYCHTFSDPAPCLAKRFAAKEAVAKALGLGMRQGIWFRDIEVLNQNFGKPTLQLHGETKAWCQRHYRTYQWHLSLSDEKKYALAFVLLEVTG
ncbi:holo-ACP synthase [Magnetococcales bacterium HHB-1]